jgi:hypothetical protein
MNRIIYPNDDGGVSIIVPTESALATMTIEDIALKDVPAGKPFKIVATDDIPSDRTFRNAWEADMSSPDGTGMGHEAWFAAKAAAEAAAEAAQNTGDAA